jgi:hypothetical protein
MAPKSRKPKPFNILCIGQGGRLQYEALILAASLRASSPDFVGRLIVAEPQPGPLWPSDPRMAGKVKDYLVGLGAESEPFLFLDTDTLVTGDLGAVAFDFTRPAASMRREGTWPVEDLYWPGYAATWKSLYDRFGLDFDSSLDLGQPDEYWGRYLYFNAGWFFGADPKAFGARFLDYALSIRDDPPAEMALQPLDPWLDQVALPLVVHSFGGGRPGPELAGLDGDVTCHYRLLPLLYARESDRVVEILEAVAAPNPIKKLLKDYEPAKRMIFQGRGRKARALFDQDDLPRREQQIRNKLKSEGFWMR